MLVRAHYFYDAGPAACRAAGRGRIIDVTGAPLVEDLCLAADALITDYSSIMFDYANLDRPIVVYADDWDVYRETRGVYFDLLAGGRRARVRPHPRGELIEPSSATAAGTRARPRRCAPRSGSASASSTTGTPPSASCAGCCSASRPRPIPPVIPLAERVPAPAATLVRS